MSPPRPDPEASHPAVRVGIDVVEVARVRRLLTEQPGIERTLFTSAELAYCSSKRRRDEHLSGRFAAKEAVLKSFGTGLGTRMRWTDVEITRTGRGRPRVHLHGEVAAVAERRGLLDLDVSLSHTSSVAVAHAVSVWRRQDG